MEKFYFFFLLGAAIFTIMGAIFNWDWFFENRKARLMVSLLGRTGARVFYIIVGLFVAALSFSIL
ncbi:MAG: hypothetical protein BWY74_02936 [Firmicutes bacterium ADurb.Bin419]|nr:MAG: hypothetical protein BWY74_02936 [Firmicutes bacterium ADurb.Bin419]